MRTIQNLVSKKNTATSVLCPYLSHPIQGHQKGAGGSGKPLLPCPPEFSSPGGHMAQDRSHPSPVPLLHLTGDNREHREIISSRPSNELLTQNSSPLVLKSVSLFLSFLPSPLPPTVFHLFQLIPAGQPSIYTTL